MPILILALVLIMAGIGAAGYFLIRKVNSEPEDFNARIDKTKLAEWEKAAEKFDASKAERDSCSGSDAYCAADDIYRRAVQAFPGGMTVRVKLGSLTEYMSFDAVSWLKQNADAEEFGTWLSRGRQALSLWADLRPDFDRAGVMTGDENDSRAAAAAGRRLRGALRQLCGGVIVQYTFTDADTGKSYVNDQLVDMRKLALLSGTSHDGYADIIGRYEFLSSQGYRCRRCGRSPLSGAHLERADGPAGAECLCENCRGNG